MNFWIEFSLSKSKKWYLKNHWLDFITSISGATTAVANVGPGLGEIIGPSGSFKSLDDVEKYILILAMILGRLELLVAMAFFLPIFWKQ